MTPAIALGSAAIGLVGGIIAGLIAWAVTRPRRQR